MIWNKKKAKLAEDTALGIASQNTADKFGDAVSEFIKGYKGIFDENGKLISKGLKQISKSKVNSNFEYDNLKQQAGYAAEKQYVINENVKNILHGHSTRYARPNDVGLGNDQKIDILAIDIDGKPILENGQPLWSAQMKFCGRYETTEEIIHSSKVLAKKLAGDEWEKYRGNKVLVPSEQYEHIKKYAHGQALKLHEQAKRFRLSGEYDKADSLEIKAQVFDQVSKDVMDSGISSKEAMFIREHAKLATAKYVAETSHHAGIQQAKTGAVISGAIAISQNIISIFREEKDINEAVKDAAISTAKGSTTSYIIGASGTAIKGVMNASDNSVFVNLSKTTMPAMLASASVQVSKSLISYAKGEIDELELAQELGEKGTGMIAASWGAAAGTFILPGVGTMLGGMAGFMTSTTIYKSAIEILNEERVSKIRKDKIKMIADYALISMTRQQDELNQMIYKYYANQRKVFNEGFRIIKHSIACNDMEGFTFGLNKLAVELGTALKFKNFEEFDSFMSDKDSALEF